MKSLRGSLGLALCGLLTTVFVALAHLLLESATGISFFALMMWRILPAGACMVGIAAASGYYFGALYLDRRPTPALLAQMVMVSALAQFLIYYLSYLASVLDDGTSVADVLPFLDFLDQSLSQARWRDSGPYPGGQMGAMTYVYMLIQFAGLLSGSVGVYYFLRSKAYCGECSRYLRWLATVQKFFSEKAPALAHVDALDQCQVGDPAFTALIQAPLPLADKPAQGAHRVDSVLSGCPACKKQFLEHKLWTFDSGNWKEDNITYRETYVADGVDLLPVFLGQAEPLKAA
jgi:hypothetical protein